MTDGGPFEPFDLSVLHAGRRVWLSASSRLGAVHAVPLPDPSLFALPSLADDAEWFRSAIGLGVPEPDRGTQFGTALRDAVFSVPEIASLFGRTRGAAAAAGRPLLLRLLAAPDDVAALPWELLVDPDDAGTPLVFAPDVHLVRVARDRRYPLRTEPVAPPLNVLLVLSNPQAADLPARPADDVPFDHYEEGRALLAELDGLRERGLLQVDVEHRPTVENLRRRIGARPRGYHVVHYLGHARPDALKLEDASGGPLWVPGAEFNALLRSCPDLRLTVFAGCRTASTPTGGDTGRDGTGQGDTGGLAALSVADRCVREACQTVLGMQAVLPFRTEQVLTRFFYQALCSGATAARALALARAAVRDDRMLGPGLLNWAVPSLVTGHEPVAIVDPAAPTAPPPPAPRPVRLKLELAEPDREFFARFAQLKAAVSVLGRLDAGARVLWVTGPPGSGKSRLLTRALDELDGSVVVLYVTAPRLARDGAPVESLCLLVAELLVRAQRSPPARDRGWTAAEWWDRLVEELVETPFVLALNDVDRLEPAFVPELGTAIDRLVARVTQARVGLAGDDTGRLLGPATRSLVAHVNVLHLEPREVLDWVRRNRPALAAALLARPASDLAAVHNQLGPALQLWSDLAAEWTRQRIKDLDAAVAAVVAAARPEPPPTGTAPADGARPGPLRVALAGSCDDAQRQRLADGIAEIAVAHGTSGRVVPAGASEPSSAVARLLPPTALTLPRTDGPPDVVVVLDRAAAGAARDAAAAALFVAPPGVRAPRAGALLRVVSLGADGRPDPPTRSRPVLHVTCAPPGFPAGWADDPARACLAALAAVVLVWSVDRTVTGADVVDLLHRTAAPLPRGAPDAGRLDLDAALAAARTRLVDRALGPVPLDTPAAAAATGLPADVVGPLLDGLVEDGTARRDGDRHVRATAPEPRDLRRPP